MSQGRKERHKGGLPPDAEAGIDFSPLDPTQDRDRFQRFVREMGAAAREAFSHRRPLPRLGDIILHWKRPIFAASGLLLLWSLLIFAIVDRPVVRQSMDEALGIPAPWARWSQAQEKPTASEILFGNEMPGDERTPWLEERR